MKRLAWVLMRVAGIGTAVAVLAGCGGAVSQTGPVPVSGPSADRAQPHAGRSRMAPGATSGDLLYVADAGYPRVYMLSYPQGKLVGTLTGFRTEGECVDKAGDVFITQYLETYEGDILEYAHGGTSPIATLSAPGGPRSCSVDPVTGNLAVVIYTSFDSSEIAIYPGAQGNPTIYSDPNAPRMFQCIYDNQGNLFVSGGGVDTSGSEALVELPAGSGSFTGITVEGSITFWDWMQWDGHYIALGNYSSQASYYVYRLRVSGTTGKVVGTTTLTLTRRKQFWYNGSPFWIQGNRIIATGSNRGTSSSEGGQVYFWKYPAGGKKPTKTIGVGSSPWFVTVSPG